jgi:aryl-alcohol dehydrogenase-like predicted oxidoreductase
MEFRQISSTGLVLPVIGLGTVPFTGSYGAASRAGSTHVIHTALDLGMGLIVLADHYGGGAIERLVGAAVATRRAEALIVTQGGTLFDHDGAIAGTDGSPAQLRRSCDASLSRLGTGHIDLYVLSRVDARVPLAESVGAMAELVRAGKVRYIGLPALPRQRLREAGAEHPVTAVIGEYALWQRDAEAELLPAARELGVAFLACMPLGRGFMTGRLTSARQLGPADTRRGDPRFAAENFRRNRLLLRAGEEIASHRDLGIGRLALSYLIAQRGTVIPVPGTRWRAHAEMNATAVSIRLSAQQRQDLEEAVPPDAIAGAAEWRRTAGVGG